MAKKKDLSPQSVINSYRRRQQVMPFILGIFAVLLIVVGVVILVSWFSNAGAGGVKISFFSSPTPTPTETFTPTPITPTATMTLTATETATLLPTETGTPSGPFEYVVEEDDICWDLAQKFNVDFAVLLAINNFGDSCPIQPGKKILIPAPGQAMPTNTPLPIDEMRGAVIEYTVRLNDSLDKIAIEHHSSIEDIMQRNGIAEANKIEVGQVLKIKIGIATPIPTYAPTSTSAP